MGKVLIAKEPVLSGGPGTKEQVKEQNERGRVRTEESGKGICQWKKECPD